MGIPIKLSNLELAGPNSLIRAECVIVSIKLTIKGILEKLQTSKESISKCNSYASKEKVMFQTDINLLEIFQSFINKELEHSKFQSMLIRSWNVQSNIQNLNVCVNKNCFYYYYIIFWIKGFPYVELLSTFYVFKSDSLITFQTVMLMIALRSHQK